MYKTRRKSGGKQKTRCWRRRNKKGQRYTVCKGSKGQRGVYKRKGTRRKRTSYAKRRLRQRGGYSGVKVPFSPANFQGPSQPTLPPFGPVKVPVPGVTKVHDGEYYYAKNNRVIAAPTSTNSAWGKNSQKGAGKRKKRKGRGRRHKCPKTGKSICYCKHKGRGRQHGGSSSSVVNAIPFGTDLRDAYWSSGTKLVNLWDNWNGFSGRMSPTAAVQPIGEKPGTLFTDAPDIAMEYADAALQASKPPYQVN